MSASIPPTPIEMVAARTGFDQVSVPPELRATALHNLERWLTEAPFKSYRAQLLALIAAERWETLVDSFYRVLPFGTGGRRGRVGVGPNRFNPWTLGASVQGHAEYLRRTRGDGELRVVIAYDVRCFQDHRGELVADAPSPVPGMSSRNFAEIAAEVYAARDIGVWLPAENEPMSTPELSHAIRALGAQGGLVISASHNHPDDNGGKFYNHTGGQEVPPRDEEMAALVQQVNFVDRMSLDRARATDLVRSIPPEVAQAYIQANAQIARTGASRSAHIVFAALHGTGRRTVFPVLQAAGFRVALEPTSAEYDGAFPSVPFQAPNPELPRAMDQAVAFAEREGAELVMATDPDADRIGLMVRASLVDPSATDPVRWRFFSGNEIAALIAHYRLSHRGSTAAPIVFKTEVTSSLLTRVARKRGARVIGHLLVGFKYIGDALDQLEQHGRFGSTPGALADFVLGAEESHGVLLTPAVRDKDAAGGAVVLAELASIEKDRGRTLVDTLEDLWREVGAVGNTLRSLGMEGAAGRAKIQALQAALRAHPPTKIGDRQVLAVHDRQDPSGPLGPIVSETDRASRDVLVFELEAGARVILRPSGTEPKTKIYAEVAAPPEADPRGQRRRVQRAADHLAEVFILAALNQVGLGLPPWALAASDLLPVERKAQFAGELLPRLIELLAGDGPEQTAREALTAALVGWPSGAQQLLLPAVRAYADTHPGPESRGLCRLFDQPS